MASRNTHRQRCDENAAPIAQQQGKLAKPAKRYAARATATAAAVDPATAVDPAIATATANVMDGRRALADMSNRAALQPLGNAKVATKAAAGTKKRAAGGDPIAHRTRSSRRRAEMDQVEVKVSDPAAVADLDTDSDDLSLRLHGSTLLQGGNSAEAYAATLNVPDDVVDIDACDEHLHEPSLALPIIRSYLEREATSMASPTYMSDVQRDLTPRMRLILIDWLVDVHRNFRMEAPSLYLTVSIVDRFLSQSQVARSKLQLVGVAALWMASKYEEIYPPVLDDFVAITDWTYSREQVISMEALICNRLGFRLTVVTQLPFLERNLKAVSHTHGRDDRVEYFAHYAIELALCDYEMLHHTPSVMAAAAVALATHAIRPRQVPWDSTLVFHSGGYSIDQLQDCAAQLVLLVQKSAQSGSKHTAVRRKYSDHKYAAIALAADEFDFTIAGHRDK